MKRKPTGRCLRPACKHRRDSEAAILNALTDLLHKLKAATEENDILRKALNWRTQEAQPS